MNFALHAGQEHKNLRRPGFDPQIKIVTDDGEEVLEYTEDLSTKTNKGGLKNGNMLGKSSSIYPAENPEHCPVRLYKKYIEQLPPPGKYKELYLQANSNKRINKGECWYVDRPIGINTLSETVKHLSKMAGIPGFRTNHSLRSSCATLLYNDPSNLPEQVIAERTGHKSLAIRSYKHTKKSLKRKVSNILTDPSSSQNNPELDKSKPQILKHSDLKAMRDGRDENVKRVQLDITVHVNQ